MKNTKSNLPRSIYEGDLNLVGLVIPCAVLDDGTRILTQREFLTTIGRSPSISGGSAKTVDGDKLPPFIGAKNLEPIAKKSLTVATNSVEFIPIGGGTALGYRAELLPEVCQIYREASRTKVLRDNQRHIAAQCEILVDALLKTSIVALVDEATGYQEVRPKNDLQAMLKMYVRDTPVKWNYKKDGRVFPKSFYEAIYGLKGWDYDPSNNRHPIPVANITIDSVYRRIQPDLWEELTEKNPRVKGRRKYCCWRLLSENIGNPHLREHLYSVTRLMQGSNSWEQYQLFLNRFHPITNNIQLDIFFDLVSKNPDELEKWNALAL